MEYALRLFNLVPIGSISARLNPCFNGICSAIKQLDEHGVETEVHQFSLRLNPCFNGICSAMAVSILKRPSHLKS